MARGIKVYPRRSVNPRPPVVYPSAVTFEVTDTGTGHLVLKDNDGRLVAVWAHGSWERLEPHEPREHRGDGPPKPGDHL